MSSEAGLLHRIGRSRHKFPENSLPFFFFPLSLSPPLHHPNTARPWLPARDRERKKSFFPRSLKLWRESHRLIDNCFLVLLRRFFPFWVKRGNRSHGDGKEENPDPPATSGWGGGAWTGGTKGAGHWARTARKSETSCHFSNLILVSSFTLTCTPHITTVDRLLVRIVRDLTRSIGRTGSGNDPQTTPLEEFGTSAAYPVCKCVVFIFLCVSLVDLSAYGNSEASVWRHSLVDFCSAVLSNRNPP